MSLLKFGLYCTLGIVILLLCGSFYHCCSRINTMNRTISYMAYDIEDMQSHMDKSMTEMQSHMHYTEQKRTSDNIHIAELLVKLRNEKNMNHHTADDGCDILYDKDGEEMNSISDNDDIYEDTGCDILYDKDGEEIISDNDDVNDFTSAQFDWITAAIPPTITDYDDDDDDNVVDTGGEVFVGDPYDLFGPFVTDADAEVEKKTDDDDMLIFAIGDEKVKEIVVDSSDDCLATVDIATIDIDKKVKEIPSSSTTDESSIKKETDSSTIGHSIWQTPPIVVAPTSWNYTKYSMKDLKQIALIRKLTDFSKLKRNELVAKLIESEKNMVLDC